MTGDVVLVDSVAGQVEKVAHGVAVRKSRRAVHTACMMKRDSDPSHAPARLTHRAHSCRGSGHRQEPTATGVRAAADWLSAPHGLHWLATSDGAAR